MILKEIIFRRILHCIVGSTQGFAWSPSLGVFAWWQICLLEVACLSPLLVASTFPPLLPDCSPMLPDCLPLPDCFTVFPLDSDRLPIMSRNSRKLSLSLPVWSNFLKVASICSLFRFLHTSLNSWGREHDKRNENLILDVNSKSGGFLFVIRHHLPKIKLLIKNLRGKNLSQIVA